MDPVVTGSPVAGRASAPSTGRLAFASITAEKQQSARAATQRAPLTVRIVRLDISETLTALG
ncbi:hypothetical protein AO398_12445 [Methylobacterium sp. GXS13]|nr:hypothetical protein AO398_12445 [Methylobacterium sp. GXS13]